MSISSGDVYLGIYDYQTFTSTITVPSDPSLPTTFAVRVTLGLQHTYASDLVITLTSPSGQTDILHNGVGGWSDFRGVYTIADAAAGDLSSLPTVSWGYYDSVFPPTAAFQPSQALSSVFVDGTAAAGSWVLSVSDQAGWDQGVLSFWSLELVTGK